MNSEVSSFQGLLSTQMRHFGLTSVMNSEVSTFQGCPYRGVPLYNRTSNQFRTGLLCVLNDCRTHGKFDVL